MVNTEAPFLRQVQLYLSSTRVKRLFVLGTELFGAMSPFLEKPTWWAGAQSIFGMGKIMVEDSEVWSEDYFATSEWCEAYSSDFTQTLLSVLVRHPYERFKTSEEHTFIRICTLPGGIRCGWTYRGRQQNVERIYVDAQHLDAARAYIKAQLWEQFSGKSLLMRKSDRSGMFTSRAEEHIIFEIDDDFQSKLSARAVSYAEYLKRPLAEGVSRSVMFYGPPGTGKSTLARTIVELMGLRSFRIRISDLQSLDNGTLFEAINIFEPDVVIMDDFDRAHAQGDLLETMEFFQEKVKLIFTTVNNRGRLETALKRPGRIDELVCIDKMDAEVVHHVLDEYDDAFELVKDWPIAFINEYVKRRKFMDPDEASRSMVELTERVNELSGDDDEDHRDINRMMVLLERARELEAMAAVASGAVPAATASVPIGDLLDDDAPDTEPVPLAGDG